MFYSAASDNIADTVSISWGQAEEDYFAATNGGVDYTDQLTAIHQALLEGAAQGQSYFTSAGDAGAYDVNDSNNAPAAVLLRAADRGFARAATLPSPRQAARRWRLPSRGIPAAGCPNITITQERVWGWDYIAQDWARLSGEPRHHGGRTCFRRVAAGA